MVMVRRMRAEGWQDGAVGRALAYGPKDLSVTPQTSQGSEGKKLPRVVP